MLKNPWSRVWFLLLLGLGALNLFVPSASATSCRYEPTAFQSAVMAWKETCKLPNCGSIHVTNPKKVIYKGGLCDGDPWLAFVEDVGKVIEKKGVRILGEVHDNADQHAVRAKLVEAGKAAVFEQLKADKQGAIDAFFRMREASSPKQNVDDFYSATDFTKSGWDAAKFKPLFDAVINANMPIYAGDPPREVIMKTAKEGEAALSVEDRTRLKLDTPLDAKLTDASLTEIEASHCGVMPKSAFTGMAFAQRYRDAHLADVALTAAARHGAALVFTGNNHARTDRGIAWYIRQREPETKVISVMFVEAEEGPTDPGAYVPYDPDGKPAVDYIIFTPQTEREDPCIKMREKMKKPNP
jgi:uncharacterized iron-regulated protein